MFYENSLASFMDGSICPRVGLAKTMKIISFLHVLLALLPYDDTVVSAPLLPRLCRG